MAGRLNIWILSSQIPPVVGGIARYCSNAADMFAAAGHQVTLIAPGNASSTITLASGVRQVQFVPTRANHALASVPEPQEHSTSMSYWPALSLDMADQVYALADHDGRLPDVVECQEYGGLAYFYILRRLAQPTGLANVPLVVTLHSPHYAIQRANGEPEYRLPSYWVGCMERFVIAGADRLLASSQFLSSMIQRDLPHLHRPIDIIPLPYRPFEQAAFDAVEGELLYYGRLQVLKGVVPLVEACERLWQSSRQFRLTLIGLDTAFVREGMPVGQYLGKRFHSWIERGNLTIIADAPLADQELWKRIATAWAVVIPSTWENFPNTCIESMALGKLVIASTAGGQAEIVGDPSNGVVFDWGVEGSCEAAITQALSFSRTELSAIGERARRRVQQLTSFEQILPRRVQHFEDVIATFSPARHFPTTSPAIQGRHTEIPDPEDSAAFARVDIAQCSDSTALYERIEQANNEFVLLESRDSFQNIDPVRDAVALFKRYANLSYIGLGSNPAGLPACHLDMPIQLAYNLIEPPVLARRSHLLAWGFVQGSAPLHADAPHLLADVWLRLAAHGCLGTTMTVVSTFASTNVTQVAGNQRLYQTEVVTNRHPELYNRYGAELFALQNANGPSLRWNHPAAEQLDFRARYFELLGAHQRLLRFLKPAAPAVKALRILKKRFGRPS